MSHLRPRATASASSSAHQEHVRGTIRATILFLLAVGLAAVIAAPRGSEAAAPAWTDSLPTFAAGG